MKILKKCKRFAQMSFEFVTDLPKTLNWRQRLIASFGKDPLICSNCKQEMELWRIWHPGYGDIYDLCRDSPAMEYEEDSQKDKAKGFMESSPWTGQLPLFSV